jgi:hypothetical protein
MYRLGIAFAGWHTTDPSCLSNASFSIVVQAEVRYHALFDDCVLQQIETQESIKQV